MKHEIGQNNYNAYKVDFKKDTKLDADVNVAEYITYYNARMTDMHVQVSAAIFKEVAAPKQPLSHVENLLIEIRDLLRKR